MRISCKEHDRCPAGGSHHREDRGSGSYLRLIRAWNLPAGARRATIVLLFFTVLLQAQETVTLKYFGLTMHPFGDNSATLEPFRLDDHARFVANFGGFAGYEKFVWEDIVSVKIIQGVFTDCSAGLAGLTHVGVRGVLLDRKKQRLSFGIGPVFMYRDSWRRFGGRYTPSGFFNETHTQLFGDVQWKLFPAGFEFEYDVQLNDKTDFSASFTPGVPLACIFSVGVKYWLSKDFREKVKLVRP